MASPIKCSFLTVISYGFIISQCLTFSANVPARTTTQFIFSEENDNKTLSDSEGVQNTERIVTNLVFLEIGVHIDFGYNQTHSEVNAVVSAPGCPKALEGRPWVYHGTPLKCVLIGFRGPCPWGQRIFQLENSNFGICNCDCFAVKQADNDEPLPEPAKLTDYDIKQNLIVYPKNERRGRRIRTKVVDYSLQFQQRRCNRTKSGALIVEIGKMKPEGNLIFSQSDQESPPRYNFCFSDAHHRQVVYDSVIRKCYPFLDQGPCQTGEWLVKNLDDNAVLCEKRKCDEFSGYEKSEYGGVFTYFDYKRQECVRETFGALKEEFFHSGGTIIPNRGDFCKQAGMKYSSVLKTCVKDHTSKIQFSMVG